MNVTDEWYSRNMFGGFMAAIERLPTSYSSLYMAQLIICKVFSVLIQSKISFISYIHSQPSPLKMLIIETTGALYCILFTP
jgi:hypothetical protein